MIHLIKKFVKKYKKGLAKCPEIFKLLSEIRKERET